MVSLRQPLVSGIAAGVGWAFVTAFIQEAPISTVAIGFAIAFAVAFAGTLLIRNYNLVGSNT